MTDEERDEGEPKVHEVSTSDSIGVGLGEGLIVHGTGVDSDAIRVVDSRGWTRSVRRGWPSGLSWKRFRQRYAGDARGIGFQAVWIVGASEAFTERLDV
jgi:hypothetical protein